MARLGCSAPSTLRMSGTRRTTRSESGRQLRKPTPAACWANSRQRRERARRRGQKLRRIVAGGDETRLGGICGAVRRFGDPAAQDDRHGFDRARKGVVRGLAGRRVCVGAVLFREQEIEHNSRGPGAFQRFRERRHAVARPWPLPKALQRFLVDIDDADGLVERVGARLPALVLVEDQVLNHRARRRADHSGNERERASGGRGQRVEFGLACFSHALLAVPRGHQHRGIASPVKPMAWRHTASRRGAENPTNQSRIQIQPNWSQSSQARTNIQKRKNLLFNSSELSLFKDLQPTPSHFFLFPLAHLSRGSAGIAFT